MHTEYEQVSNLKVSGLPLAAKLILDFEWILCIPTTKLFIASLIVNVNRSIG